MQREELTWADIRSEILKNRQPEHWLMRRKPINLRLVGVLLSGVLPRPTGLRGIGKSNFLDRVRQCLGCAGVLEGGQTVWRGGEKKTTTRPRRCDVLSRHRYDMRAYERMPGVPSISHLAFSFGDHDVLGSDS